MVLTSQKDRVDIQLFCPEKVAPFSQQVQGELSQILADNGLAAGAVQVQRMERYSRGRTASMSRYDSRATNRAVALKYDGEGAPVVVASGMGYLAERMIEVASESGVPVYEDNSLATMLSQLALGQEIPDALYQAIVEIYVYFLNFDPKDPDKFRREREERAAQAAPAPAQEKKGES